VAKEVRQVTTRIYARPETKVGRLNWRFISYGGACALHSVDGERKSFYITQVTDVRFDLQEIDHRPTRGKLSDWPFETLADALRHAESRLTDG
jgi:hypothetical protein